MAKIEILVKMLAWIASEKEKAKDIGAEPFLMTSLTYCANRAAGEGSAIIVRDAL